MAKGKMKEMWISRDRLGDAYLELWGKKKPDLENGTFSVSDGGERLLGLCPEDFERVTGLTVKKGECFRVDVIVRRRKSTVVGR